MALQTAAIVNQHLNVEVEKYVKRLAQLQSERDAWQQHARSLSRKLAEARREACPVSPPPEELPPAPTPSEPADSVDPAQSLLSLDWPDFNSEPPRSLCAAAAPAALPGC